MTDTTDIAALRSKAANVIGLLTAESRTESFALDSLADVFDDMFQSLEAERQRADKAQADMQFECDAHIETAESWREWKLRAITAEEALIKEREHSANFEREANLYHEKCETAEAEIAALKPNGLVMPDGLHPDTKALVLVFASAMAVKLHKAEKKYGYDNSWKNDNWQRECQRDLLAHVTKGDPLDVAAYCAFMWHHGWTTAPKPAVKGE